MPTYLPRSFAATHRRGSPALAPKVSVIVDGGGRVDLDALAADIRLGAVMSDEGPKFELALTGDAVTAALIAVIAIEDAVDEVLVLLKAIAARGADARASAAALAAGAGPLAAARDADGDREQPRLEQRVWLLSSESPHRLGKGHPDGIHIDLRLTPRPSSATGRRTAPVESRPPSASSASAESFAATAVAGC